MRIIIIITAAIITNGVSIITANTSFHPEQRNTLQEFVRQLTDLLNRGGGNALTHHSSDSLLQTTPVEYFSNPYRESNYPIPSPLFPYDGIQSENFITSGGLPYHQEDTTLAAALSSIARHDDLRCVPRILCEVTAGTLPEKSSASRPHKQKQQSTLPFLSKDTLIRLLTVLNFVDNSPMLLFARAAFLGYTSRGDSKSCLAAYPTCPKDPNQLIDYLNNYNGGFFKFFNNRVQDQQQSNEDVRNRKQISKRILNSPIDIVPEAAIPILPPTSPANDLQQQHTKHLENFLHTRENKRIVFPKNDVEHDDGIRHRENSVKTAAGYGKRSPPTPPSLVTGGVRGGKSIRNKFSSLVFPIDEEIQQYAVEENINSNEVFVPDDRKVIPSKVTFSSDVEFVPQFIQRTKYPQASILKFKDN